MSVIVIYKGRAKIIKVKDHDEIVKFTEDYFNK